MDRIEIFAPEKVDESLVEFVNKMLAQLSSSHHEVDCDALERLIKSEASRLYILKVDGEPSAMLTLCHYYAPTGCKAWIEDVVVDSLKRGMGLGRKIVEYALDEAKKLSPCTVLLTSRPSRKEANRLYQSVGFEARETNVYRCKK